MNCTGDQEIHSVSGRVGISDIKLKKTSSRDVLYITKLFITKG